MNQRFALATVLVVCMVVIGFFDYACVTNLLVLQSATNAVKTTGEIIESRLVTTPKGTGAKDTPSEDELIRYRYRVQDDWYESDRLRSGWGSQVV